LKPFSHKDDAGIDRYVSATTIVAGLGTFDEATRRCPARYAARISQAFTATDQAVVEVEEILIQSDIFTSDGQYCFTDGVGTLSSELARSIWKELQRTRKRAAKSKGRPRAFQVRFQGSKGMLSVDHKLKGSVISLRDSMIKFQAPQSLAVEIARAFDKPGVYFLNRPLIMILEGLGVPYSVFEMYQDKAVHEVQSSKKDIFDSAHMLEKYGLGMSFRVTSVLTSLSKLGISHLSEDRFYVKSLDFAVNHILRDLKNHARIPVPKAWTLVGVCDVHDQLEKNQIFACIKETTSNSFVYLEGPVLISRSPTIHPGDVQVAYAIGRPLPGSSFSIEPLPNTVVFSAKGISYLHEALSCCLIPFY
jgi:RNA-dependent RNA polymerase